MGKTIDVNGNIERALAMLGKEFKKEVKPKLKELEAFKKPSAKKREKIINGKRKRKNREGREGNDWKMEPR